VFLLCIENPLCLVSLTWLSFCRQFLVSYRSTSWGFLTFIVVPCRIFLSPFSRAVYRFPFLLISGDVVPFCTSWRISWPEFANQIFSLIVEYSPDVPYLVGSTVRVIYSPRIYWHVWCSLPYKCVKFSYMFLDGYMCLSFVCFVGEYFHIVPVFFLIHLSSPILFWRRMTFCLFV